MWKWLFQFGHRTNRKSTVGCSRIPFLAASLVYRGTAALHQRRSHESATVHVHRTPISSTASKLLRCGIYGRATCPAINRFERNKLVLRCQCAAQSSYSPGLEAFACKGITAQRMFQDVFARGTKTPSVLDEETQLELRIFSNTQPSLPPSTTKNLPTFFPAVPNTSHSSSCLCAP